MKHRSILAPLALVLASCVSFVALSGMPRAQRAQTRTDREIAVVALDDAPIVLEGLVLREDGSPAGGAVVSSSAGGRVLTNVDGTYRLELPITTEVERLEVYAKAGAGAWSNPTSASIAVSASSQSCAVPLLVLAPLTDCEPRWVPTFGEVPGLAGRVFSLEIFNDGSGPALFAASRYLGRGRILKWSGTRWSELAAVFSDRIEALETFDDGSGPVLVAGGTFTTLNGVSRQHIAQWDGTNWSSLGSGLSNACLALATFDDGSGSALYACGSFLVAGDQPASRIAKWNGADWSPLGTGMNSHVRALAVFDDGNGPALYAGGQFTVAGGVSAKRVARWNGTSWSPLGGGVDMEVLALTVFDDGNGPALYAGGRFTAAGSVAANRIAKWDGASWSAVGSGVSNVVEELGVHDDGGGLALYAGGSFTTAGGVAASGIAKWNGSTWSALDSGVLGTVYALATIDDGSGPALFVGGEFPTAGGLEANHIARWASSAWSVLGSGLNDRVLAVEVFDDGSGPALYAGGDFRSAKGVSIDRVAKWGGTNWAPLGSGMDVVVHEMTVFDDGSGSALYVGGAFTMAGGVAANRIARWNGTSWSALGSGMAGTFSFVGTLAGFDDGSGPALYAGGNFSTAGGVPANRIAKWDGTSWSPLSSGLDNSAQSTAVFDDGNGPALYVGGFFDSAGGVAARRIARWDGSAWTSVGGGVAGAGSIVYALAVFDDGNGPALYAGGIFSLVGGVSAQGVARWDGTSWSALGSGVLGGGTPVATLGTYDDGDGPALYAGGLMTIAGGMAAISIAKWDGLGWSPLGSGVDFNGVADLTVFDDGTGPGLVVGCWGRALDSGDTNVALWKRSCPVLLDFEHEDDFTTLLVNGQDVSTPPEFGNLVAISSAGPNAGAAIFDSTPGGPNDPSQDRDLLVGSGNVLMLQTNANTTQTVPGRFDRPNDDEDGGTLSFVFAVPVEPVSVDLVDIDSGADEASQLVLTDKGGRLRVYTLPPGWTGDLLDDGVGLRTLDLATTALQPGFGATATAIEDANFQPDRVVSLELQLGSSGALDNLTWRVPQKPLRGPPTARPRSSAGVTGLRSVGPR